MHQEFNSVISGQESILRKYFTLPSSDHYPGVIMMTSEALPPVFEHGVPQHLHQSNQITWARGPHWQVLLKDE